MFPSPHTTFIFDDKFCILKLEFYVICVFKALEIDGLLSTCFKHGVIKEEMGMGLKVEKGEMVIMNNIKEVWRELVMTIKRVAKY
jgi:hypothetical protein